MPDEQYCSRCDTLKELCKENFYRDASNKTGFAKNWCKDCTKKYNNDRNRRIKLEGGYGFTKDELATANKPPSANARAFDDVCFDEWLNRAPRRIVSTFMPIEVAIPLSDEKKEREIIIL